MKTPCAELHEICSKLPRIKYPFDVKTLPKNGIYVVFEDGEKAYDDVDRIVRIGSHTGKANLRKRLTDHYEGTKDRSIFRRNIGRAFLNQDEDKYLCIWDIDFTTKKNQELYNDKRDCKKEEKIEKRISDYLRTHTSFVFFPVEEKEQRLELEMKMIGTISTCNECKPSENWLGLQSPKDKIKLSGLWQDDGVAVPLTDEDMNSIRSFIN